MFTQRAGLLNLTRRAFKICRELTKFVNDGCPSADAAVDTVFFLNKWLIFPDLKRCKEQHCAHSGSDTINQVPSIAPKGSVLLLPTGSPCGETIWLDYVELDRQKICPVTFQIFFYGLFPFKTSSITFSPDGRELYQLAT